MTTCDICGKQGADAKRDEPVHENEEIITYHTACYERMEREMKAEYDRYYAQYQAHKRQQPKFTNPPGTCARCAFHNGVCLECGASQLDGRMD